MVRLGSPRCMDFKIIVFRTIPPWRASGIRLVGAYVSLCVCLCAHEFQHSQSHAYANAHSVSTLLLKGDLLSYGSIAWSSIGWKFCWNYWQLRRIQEELLRITKHNFFQISQLWYHPQAGFRDTQDVYQKSNGVSSFPIQILFKSVNSKSKITGDDLCQAL